MRLREISVKRMLARLKILFTRCLKNLFFFLFDRHIVRRGKLLAVMVITLIMLTLVMMIIPLHKERVSEVRFLLFLKKHLSKLRRRSPQYCIHLRKLMQQDLRNRLSGRSQEKTSEFLLVR